MEGTEVSFDSNISSNAVAKALEPQARRYARAADAHGQTRTDKGFA